MSERMLIVVVPAGPLFWPASGLNVLMTRFAVPAPSVVLRPL
jgi:hypothetical protein